MITETNSIRRSIKHLDKLARDTCGKYANECCHSPEGNIKWAEALREHGIPTIDLIRTEYGRAIERHGWTTSDQNVLQAIGSARTSLEQRDRETAQTSLNLHLLLPNILRSWKGMTFDEAFATACMAATLLELDRALDKFDLERARCFDWIDFPFDVWQPGSELVSHDGICKLLGDILWRCSSVHHFPDERREERMKKLYPQDVDVMPAAILWRWAKSAKPPGLLPFLDAKVRQRQEYDELVDEIDREANPSFDFQTVAQIRSSHEKASAIMRQRQN